MAISPKRQNVASTRRSARRRTIAVGCVALGLPLLGTALTQSGAAASSQVVGGTVWRDLNRDGLRSGSEVGVANLWIRAFGQLRGLDGTLGTADDVETASDPVKTDDTGAWTSPTVASDAAVRIEHYGLDSNLNGTFDLGEEALPSWLTPSLNGPDNFGKVQFAGLGEMSLKYAVSNPTDYCDSQPSLAVTCFTQGDQSTATDSVVKMPWSSTFATTETPLASSTVTGSVYGIAHQRRTNQVLLSAFTKRHVGMGNLGSGGIYAINAQTGTLAWSVDARTLAIDTGTVPTNSSRGLGAPTAPAADAATFALVGRSGFGDIAISEDDSSLWAISLATNWLYRLPVPGTTPIGPAQPIHGMVGVCDKPFAVTEHDGNVYVGKVCTDASGFEVVAYSPSSQSWSTTITKTDFAVRGCVKDSFGCDWQPWTDTYPSNPEGSAANPIWAQPILSDITFDNDDSMILTFMDRWGHQTGSSNLTPDAGLTVSGVANGNTERWCRSAATYARCATVANGTEWYVGRDPGLLGFGESAAGATAMFPGATTVAFTQSNALGTGSSSVGWYTNAPTVVAPLATNFSAGQQIPLTNPASNQKWGVLTSSAADAGALGTATGLGDLEVLCAEAPREVQSRVWMDANRDGIQGAGEAPLAGVAVSLVTGGNTIATAQSDGLGRVRFSAAVGVSTASTLFGLAITPATSYELVVPLGQSALSSGNYQLTIANQADLTHGDNSDSDAVTSASTAVATVISGAAGSVDSADFGFVSPVPQTTTTVPTTAAPTTEPATTTIAQATTTTVLSVLDTTTTTPATTTATTTTSVTTTVSANTGSIEGRAWFDPDIDGIRKPTDVGAPNVVLQLYTLDGDVIATTATGADGTFRFTNLTPNDYALEFTLGSIPRGRSFTLMDGAPTEDSDSDVDAAGFTDKLTVVAGRTLSHVDAGITGPSPSNLSVVTTTLMPNGQQASTSTSPIRDSNSTATTTTRVGTPTSSPSGSSAPANAAGALGSGVGTTGATGTASATPTPQSGANSAAGTGQAALTGASGSAAPNESVVQDAACAISGLVWIDRNSNGSADAGERAVPGAVVIRTLPSGATSRVAADGSGQFAFPCIENGPHQVEIGGRATPTNGPRVRMIEVLAGSAGANVDFGFSAADVKGVLIEAQGNVLALTGASSLKLVGIGLIAVGLGTFALPSAGRRRRTATTQR